MAYSLTDYLAEAKRLTKDDAQILGEAPNYLKIATPALRDYSLLNPLEKNADVAGNGGDITINSTNFPGFEVGFSVVQSIEYPISNVNEKPTILPDESYTIYRIGSTYYIRFLGNAIPTGASGRFTWTARHTFADNPETITIPDEDFVQFTKLIAAEACMLLSRHYSQSSESVAYQGSFAITPNKAKEFEARAKQLRDEALNPRTGAFFV